MYLLTIERCAGVVVSGVATGGGEFGGYDPPPIEHRRCYTYFFFWYLFQSARCFVIDNLVL